MQDRRVIGKRLGIVLATALTASLVFNACGPMSIVEENRVVQIGDIAPLTGATAGPEQINLEGWQDYVKYFNEQRGIPGLTIDLLWIDTSLDAARFLSAYQMFVERGVPIIYSDNSLCLYAVQARLPVDQVPVFTATATATLIYPPGWVYCPSPTFGEVSTAVLEYFLENWREERPARVTYFGLDGYVGRGAAEEVTEYAESIGIDLLPFELAPYVVIDATPQLMRMKERGTDLAILHGIVPTVAPILKDAARLGLLEEMQFAGLEFTIGDTLMHMASPANTEGYLAPRTTPWFDEAEIPGIALIQEMQQRYHGKTRSDPEYMSGWLSAAIVCEAIKRATEEVGYENLDGVTTKMALDSMEEFDVHGIARISYTPEQRRGSRVAAVYQIIGGKVVRVSEWRETPVLVP
jgi:branched-chain amino acid transport system substrate-binding protein